MSDFAEWLLAFISDRGMEHDRYRDLAELCARQAEVCEAMHDGMHSVEPCKPDTNHLCDVLAAAEAFREKYDVKS